MAVPRRSAQRADRRRDDSVRAVFRCHHSRAAGRIRESAVGRRYRLRPDRGRYRHHGGGDLPAAVARHRTVPDRGRSDFARDNDGDEESRDFQCGRRRVAFDLLCRGDHHCSLPAAVHAERCRGQYLRPDGANLCLRAGRRLACNFHRDAGAQCHHPARACSRGRNASGALVACALRAVAELGGGAHQIRNHRSRRAAGFHFHRDPDARAGIPAEARGGQSLDSRHAAIHHLARSRQHLRQRDAAPDC
ncbi:hypothetical protein BN961_01951 [Afipia felis]|uniref:Uncharacterized protein n=1 Tax=Afipia felis TaxID=1035 RepID=A0A090MM85_AFIFE|nr:hypothetical protein BN961_01951 [Afipia felis]